MLDVTDIHTAYGNLNVLYGVSFTAEPGKITCILGRNGAGKTTTLKTIMGLLPVNQGSVSLEGVNLSALPGENVPKHGIGYIPQGRGLFSELSVAENLEVGLMTRGKGKQTRDYVLDMFPRLRERLNQTAETLSGGEQQMLATARALCLEPKVLLLDEPTEGLQPSMIEQIRKVIVQMRDENMAVVLVEQRVDAIVELADKAVFLENGRKIDEMSRDDLSKNPDKLNQYLGV